MIFLFTVNCIQIIKHKSPIFTIKTGQFDNQAVLQLHFDVLASLVLKAVTVNKGEQHKAIQLSVKPQLDSITAPPSHHLFVKASPAPPRFNDASKSQA